MLFLLLLLETSAGRRRRLVSQWLSACQHGRGGVLGGGVCVLLTGPVSTGTRELDRAAFISPCCGGCCREGGIPSLGLRARVWQFQQNRLGALGSTGSAMWAHDISFVAAAVFVA